MRESKASDSGSRRKVALLLRTSCKDPTLQLLQAAKMEDVWPVRMRGGTGGAAEMSSNLCPNDNPSLYIGEMSRNLFTRSAKRVSSMSNSNLYCKAES